MEMGVQPVEDSRHSLFLKKLQLTCNTGLVMVITFELYKCEDSLLQGEVHGMSKPGKGEDN